MLLHRCDLSDKKKLDSIFPNESQIKCSKVSETIFSKDKFMPKPRIKYGDVWYTLKYSGKDGINKEEKYLPSMVITDKLIATFILQYDQSENRTLFTQFDLIDLLE